MRYLHTMVRVSDLEAALDFYCAKLGLKEIRRMAMGPWTDAAPSKPTKRPSSLSAAEWILLLGLLALCVIAGLALWASRYEIGTAGGLPARLDRFTGQVISCVPGQACFELIPSGEPALHTPVIRSGASAAPHAPAGNETPAGNEAAKAPAARP